VTLHGADDTDALDALTVLPVRDVQVADRQQRYVTLINAASSVEGVGAAAGCDRTPRKLDGGTHA
jgi:hypothetical protein